MADTSRSQLRKLKEEYARNPGSRVFVHLAEAHRKAGELKQAQQVLTEGLRRHGDYPSGLVVLARVLADQGEDERAAAVWRDVVRLDPENIVALRALGDIAEAAGRRVEAMQLYRRVVRLENGDPEDGESEIVPPDFDEEDAEPTAAAEPAPAPAEPVPAWRLRRVDPPAPPAAETPREPDPVPAWRMPPAEPPAPTPEPEPTPAWRMREPDPIAPAPPAEPVREPEPEAAPSPPKSRFSWLVRTVTGGRVEEPQPAPPAPPRVREETVFEAPPAAPDPVPAEEAYVPPREELPETIARYAPPEPIPAAEPIQVADPSELDADPAPLAAEPEPAAEEQEAEPFEGVLDGIDAAALAPSAYVAERWAASTDNPEVEEAPAAEDAPVAYHAASEASLPDDEEVDEVVPGDIVVMEVDDDVPAAEEEDEAEAPVASIFDGADEDITRFVQAQAQNAPMPGEPVSEPEAEASEEEPEAGPVRFDELAKLAYTARPAPPPADPLAQIRAEMYGAPQDAAEAEIGAGAAGLAEVLVRILEQQGGVMHAASSLRRLLAVALARELGLPPAQQDALALAALLSALGELRDGGEADAGRQLAVTLQLLSGVTLPETARQALAHQCERWDGGGFPAGLREERIPFPARILSVARAAAALLSERRPGAGQVVDDLQRQAGTAFDPLVVSVLRRVFAQRERHGIGYGWGGRVAVVHPHELRALELAARLHGEGYAAETAGSAAGLRELLRTGSPQALVLGADLPDADAAALVREMRAVGGSLPVLVVDATDARRRVELLGAGADVCFPADAEFPEVRATLDALLRRRESAA
jgi:HD-GYP domain-containing protein (c-di-GMP phosphodiesterase class II)